MFKSLGIPLVYNMWILDLYIIFPQLNAWGDVVKVLGEQYILLLFKQKLEIPNFKLWFR